MKEMVENVMFMNSLQKVTILLALILLLPLHKVHYHFMKFLDVPQSRWKL